MSEMINELRPGFASRISAVKESISDACSSCGRSMDEITLIGVSKVFPWEYAAAAFLEGLADLGENKVQDLTAKIDTLRGEGLEPRWHMIGTLQKNKVKYLIGKTHLIHSVNTLDLAGEISKRSVCNNVITDILLQVNVSGEESKHGFDPSDMNEVIDKIGSMEGLRLHGLMTMAPIQEYEGQAREVFAKTYSLYESLRDTVQDKSCWNVLSMGMSQDYRYAIMEGATHIRIGTAIFGDRSQFLCNP